MTAIRRVEEDSVVQKDLYPLAETTHVVPALWIGSADGEAGHFSNGYGCEVHSTQ
jgi:hypothetical protein